MIEDVNIEVNEPDVDIDVDDRSSHWTQPVGPC